ncbi:MAG: crotonase/enoyl-CoA hydratase family protein [Rhodosalinus sp.]|uniref:crotonase/enoyl-CoA hydratase family protein n=1 Tax=Rhodosalinus sp. TaxID=2047741 RepID=UPI00397B6A1A
MSEIEIEREGHVAILWLNRPDRLNAVNEAMTKAMRAALTEIEQDGSLRALVLAGRGRVFCAGMDLAAFAAGERPGLLDPDRFAGFANAQRSKPVIAAVQGAALAGGFEIVLACDMVVAAEGTKFGLPEVKRGLFPAGGGTIRLPRRIPPVLANEMLLTGEPIEASRAHALGLVNRVVPADDLVGTALDLARRIAENAPLAVRSALALARDAGATAEAELWAANDALWRRVDTSDDALEGARAFAEKRAPVWKGR